MGRRGSVQWLRHAGPGEVVAGLYAQSPSDFEPLPQLAGRRRRPQLPPSSSEPPQPFPPSSSKSGTPTGVSRFAYPGPYPASIIATPHQSSTPPHSPAPIPAPLRPPPSSQITLDAPPTDAYRLAQELRSDPELAPACQVPSCDAALDGHKTAQQTRPWSLPTLRLLFLRPCRSPTLVPVALANTQQPFF